MLPNCGVLLQTSLNMVVKGREDCHVILKLVCVDLSASLTHSHSKCKPLMPLQLISFIKMMEIVHNQE